MKKIYLKLPEAILFNMERKTQHRVPMYSKDEQASFHIGQEIGILEMFIYNDNPDSPNFGKYEYASDYAGSHSLWLIDWRYPEHMPDEAIRRTFIIKDIKIEYLEQITDADAICEGCKDAEGYKKMWRMVYEDALILRTVVVLYFDEVKNKNYEKAI